MATISINSNPQLVELADQNSHTLEFSTQRPGEHIFKVRRVSGTTKFNAYGAVTADSASISSTTTEVEFSRVIPTDGLDTICWIQGQTGSDSFIISEL